MRFTFRFNKKKERVFVLVCKDRIIVQKIKRYRTYAVADKRVYKVWPDHNVLVMYEDEVEGEYEMCKKKKKKVRK